jgi:tetratricopeptide (TPR) repeat protein
MGAGFTTIDDAYFHRDQGDNLAASIKDIDSRAPDSDLLWRRCRSLVRRGEKQEKKSARLADYDQARTDCAKAVELSSGSADAHFWLGVTLGRWGEAKGILKSLFLVKPIRKEMEQTLALDPTRGGPHRVLGEILWQVPGFAGGDKKQALVEFETAVRLNPAHSANYKVLADAYLHFDRKDDAIKTLRAVADIKTPDDPAEYSGDLAEAKAALSKLAP